MTQMNTDCFASVALVSVRIGAIGGSSMHSMRRWLPLGGHHVGKGRSAIAVSVERLKGLDYDSLPLSSVPFEMESCGFGWIYSY